MKKFLFLICILVVGSFAFLFGIKSVEAKFTQASSNVFCEQHGSGKNCNVPITWLGFNDPAYQIDWSLLGSGFGSLGPNGGRVGAWLCFSTNGAMWNGPCNHVVDDHQLNNPGCVTAAQGYGYLGNSRDCPYSGSFTPGPPPIYHHLAGEIYVNDGQLRGTVTIYGDACHFDSNASGCTDVPNPVCSDGIDNDGDGRIDVGDDPGCTAADDNDETDPVASDPGGSPDERYLLPSNPTITVGESITFKLYYPGDIEDENGGTWYAGSALNPTTVVVKTNDVDARGVFLGMEEGVADIHAWSGGDHYTWITVLPAPTFSYKLTNGGGVNVVKNINGNTFVSNTIDRILLGGTPQDVTLAITSPASFPAGVSYSISNNPCKPTCSSAINFTIAQNVAPQTIPVTVTGSPHNITTSFNLSITGTAMSVICKANPSPALIGEQVTWTATVSGGTPPFSYAWSGDVGTPNPGNVDHFSTTYSTVGLKHALVTVTDNDSNVVECSNGNDNGSQPHQGGLLYINFNPKFEEF